MTFADWLALREPADAAARSAELVERLPAADRRLIHDLGAGTGSMGRWLAPRLAGSQHWVLHDRDADLLNIANVPGATFETRRSDITRLAPGDLAGATLITASALLDMLSADEVDRLVAACARAACPALITMSVVGRVELAPADPLDRRIEVAFNAHQRRDRLGPDAAVAAVAAFRRSGMEVITRPSPWRLGPAQADLAMTWFSGWVRAACEQAPELDAEAYVRRRVAQAAGGELAVTVGHTDLLALPRSASRARSAAARRRRSA